jgi:DNA-binding helix-hairpin-helix protein with protein kinase domain
VPANRHASHSDLTGQRYRTERGDEVRLGPRVSGGGEATVYKVEQRPDLVAKIYHAGRKIDGPKPAHLLAHAPTDPTRVQGTSPSPG